MKKRAGQKTTKLSPRIDVLETRALLSGLTESLTTDQSVYQPGQPIQFVFTMTNTGSEPVHVTDGPSNDGFDVKYRGQLVYRSNAGINPMFVRVETVEPGQSLAFKATWVGVPDAALPRPATDGLYTVTNQLDPSGATASFQIKPVSANMRPSATVTANRSALRIGQPALFTLTITSSGSQSLDIRNLAKSGRFTLSQGSNTIWQSSATAFHTRAAQALAPGQSFELFGRWLGRPNHKGFRGIKAGFYQLSAVAGDVIASTTVRLSR